MCSACSRSDLTDLYRVYIKYGESVPPPFPQLLQLRGMLGLAPGEAEAVEAEVLEAGVAFEI